MNSFLRVAASFACLLILVCGCSGFFKGKAAADKAMAEFHQLYNEGKIAEIRGAADPKFQSATSDKEWSDLMAAVQRKLGKVTGTASEGFNVSTHNFTTRVVLSQKTTFEQGSGEETFTFELSGDKARLIGYNIASKELILR